MDEGAGSKPTSPEGQAVDVDDVDESKIPTAPMRAVGPRPGLPPIDFDDDDDDDDDMRVGTRENPITASTHPEIALPENQIRQIEARRVSQGPNMGAVVIRTLVILAVLGGVLFGVSRMLG